PPISNPITAASAYVPPIQKDTQPTIDPMLTHSGRLGRLEDQVQDLIARLSLHGSSTPSGVPDVSHHRDHWDSHSPGELLSLSGPYEEVLIRYTLGSAQIVQAKGENYIVMSGTIRTLEGAMDGDYEAVLKIEVPPNTWNKFPPSPMPPYDKGE